MNLLNHQDYYADRARKCRALALIAASAYIAAIHIDLAARYDVSSGQAAYEDADLDDAPGTPVEVVLIEPRDPD